MSTVTALYDVLKTRIWGRQRTDTFTRANAGTLGAGYTTVLGTVGVTGNQCAVQAASDSLATVDDTDIGADQYIQATWQAGDGYLAARLTGSGANATSAYLLVVQDEVGGAMAYLQAWPNIPGGTITTLASVAITRTAGDVWRLEAVGNRLLAFQNGTLLLSASATTFASGKVGIGGIASTARWDNLDAGTAPSVRGALTGGLWYDAPPEDQTTLPYGTMTLSQVGDGQYSGDRDEIECELLLYHRPWSKNATLRGIADDVDAALLRFVSTTAGMLLVRSRSREPLVPASPEDRDLCGVRLTYVLAVWPAYLTQYA